MCLSALRHYAKPDAVNLKSGGEWLHISGDDFIKRIRAVALGLSALGVRKGDRVALLSENRPDWSVADLAILSLGAVNVPIYTTQAPEQVQYILEDSGARVLFVSGKKVYRHARPGVEPVAGLEHVVFFDTKAEGEREGAMSLMELEQQGAEIDRLSPETFERALNEVHADDLATIIYTSGTTGEPKGVMLTHSNFVSNVLSISDSLPIRSTDIALSVLPLSHIFERTVFYVFCWNGVAVHYAASFDQVGEYLREVRPTIMTAVPRLFEKVYHRIVKKGTSAGGYKEKLFMWALGVGQRYAALKDKGEEVPPLLEIQQEVASRLVFSKWREGVGGRLRFFVSGGAALSPALSYAFLGAGVNILQGYGMTETCIVAANRPENNRVGSVGPAFPGVEVRTDAEGEILVRGPNVMRGYYNHPEETAAVFTDDGWFKTGDVGKMDEEGRLSHHRPQEGAVQAVERQVRRAAAHREFDQAEFVRQPGGRRRRGAQSTGGARRPRLGGAVSRAARAAGRGAHEPRRLEPQPGGGQARPARGRGPDLDARRLRARAPRRAAARRVLHRRRRADAHAQGQAPRHRREVRRPDRRAVRRLGGERRVGGRGERIAECGLKGRRLMEAALPSTFGLSFDLQPAVAKRR